ncbi:hypothetical protein ACE4RR_10665 [Alteribacillus sp. HJP-4]
MAAQVDIFPRKDLLLFSVIQSALRQQRFPSAFSTIKSVKTPFNYLKTGRNGMVSRETIDVNTARYIEYIYKIIQLP